jgi:hypothetical protein
MGIDKHYVRGLAESTIEAIEAVPAKDRIKTASPSSAQDVNRVLELAKEVAPKHDARLWPAPIMIEEPGAGVTQVFGTYADVERIARRVLALVPAELLFRLGGVDLHA